jgi:hypothetical protein
MFPLVTLSRQPVRDGEGFIGLAFFLHPLGPVSRRATGQDKREYLREPKRTLYVSAVGDMRSFVIAARTAVLQLLTLWSKRKELLMFYGVTIRGS